MSRTRREKSVPVDLQSTIAVISDRLASLRGPNITAAQRLVVAQELFCVLASASGMPIADLDNHPDSREGWIMSLRFLTGAGVLPQQLGALNVALAELDRGIVDPRLIAAPRKGPKDSAVTLYWKSVANEALEELAKKVGGITKAINEVEVELGVPEGTVKDLRRQVLRTAPLEWRRSPIKLSIRRSRNGQEIDPLVAFRIAYENVLSAKDGERASAGI